MAKKSSKSDAPAHGLGDVLGIVLMSLAVLILASLLSYDRNDLSRNAVPPNEPPMNWIGPFGAGVGHALFFTMGAAAYFFPIFLLGYGLSYYLSAMDYLRRHWVWTGVFLLAGMGLLDLYTANLTDLKALQDSSSAGGIVGLWMNDFIFDNFGQVGASLIFLTFYVVSLFYLTNFQLGGWVRGVWIRWKERPAKEQPFVGQEKDLAKKAKQLAKEAKKLEKEVEKSGLGADMQPVPEPQVRDMSMPQSKGDSPFSVDSDYDRRKGKETPVEMGESITPDQNVPAAKTEDILGGSKSSKSSTEENQDRDDESDAEEEEPPNPFAGKPPLKRITAASRSGKNKRISVASPPVIGDYKLPKFEHLQRPDNSIKSSETREELMGNARLMQNTLAQFGIEVALGDITKGPTITRYELHPAPGVRLEKIVNLTNNITAALKAERINILAPVPGKSSVGVEVPNRTKTMVIMRDLFESEAWRNTRKRIPIALGKDVYGEAIIGDLADMPHLLIAGATGSGKSVCINAIIASFLYKFSPEDLRLVMIDPKVVELQQYNNLPHLVVPVVTDPKKVILALRWVVNEMEKRYQIFAKVGVRNISSFNKRPKDKKSKKEEQEPELPLTVDKENIEANEEGFAVELDEEIVVPRDDEVEIPDKLSYIVVIIDELADLMLVAPADVEMAIARITQMARAAGIHCIVATQRPSVDVITGVIKANIPARIAFQVASKVDSRTILDAMGADKLLGKGDMLYLPPGSSRLIRAQGVLITDEEIHDIVESIITQGKPSYEVEIHQQLQKHSSNIDLKGTGGGDDELIEKCIDVIRSEQKASVSLLQRRLRLGYTRAARLMDQLEDMGIVGPSKGAEPRDILLDLDAQAAE